MTGWEISFLGLTGPSFPLVPSSPGCLLLISVSQGVRCFGRNNNKNESDDLMGVDDRIAEMEASRKRKQSRKMI